jgi:hypothetical protein
VVVASGVAAVLATAGIGVISQAMAADPCSPLVNLIACENSKPGNPESEWDIEGVGDATIQGFATSTSVNVGNPISFKIKTTAPSYRIDIYRLGYYNGSGARKQHTINVNSSSPQTQQCVTDPDTEIFDCGAWSTPQPEQQRTRQTRRTCNGMGETYPHGRAQQRHELVHLSA